MADSARRRSSRLLYINGQLVGIWRMTCAGEDLQYAYSWVSSQTGRPLSLCLPFTPDNSPLTGPCVHAYFSNLLPERPKDLAALARRCGTADCSPFDLLAKTGNDGYGALQIASSAADAADPKEQPSTPLEEADVAALLRQNASEGSDLPSHEATDGYRLSKWRSEEAVALLFCDGGWHKPQGSTPSSHILKPQMALGNDMSPHMCISIENEWLCSEVLRAYGIPVAPSKLLMFEEQRALAVERTDRHWVNDPSAGRWLARRPQENMCQALGVMPALKYEEDGGPGMSSIFGLLCGSLSPTDDRRTFFKVQFLFWLLCATDGHSKNFNITILAGGRFQLAPLSGVMSAFPLMGRGLHQLPPQRARLAMAVHGRTPLWRVRDITYEHWVDLGRRQGIQSASGGDCEEVMAELVGETAQIIELIQERLPAGFPDTVSAPILEGLRKAAERLQ